MDLLHAVPNLLRTQTSLGGPGYWGKTQVGIFYVFKGKHFFFTSKKNMFAIKPTSAKTLAVKHTH